MAKITGYVGCVADDGSITENDDCDAMMHALSSILHTYIYEDINAVNLTSDPGYPETERRRYRITIESVDADGNPTTAE